MNDSAAVRGDGGPKLTDEERRVVEAALDAGYYEQPRRTTHTEVATMVGSDPVTVARTLRRAERRALRELSLTGE
ncbi:helix-turn-helix domain-containing protein [Halosegnis marinus]|uniref:Helix-turn-helix domain-containing protein n=1 Tax=Halosegnis marinus TaxID=3034023 RepID=A0ABD5ZMQ0_9EURY|nr:helix-turn-helix domain-containing protein [Halosegnis sp. DT85]